MRRSLRLTMTLVLLGSPGVHAGVGNPQIRTDHPLYPGELAYSTLDRFAQSVIHSGDWGLGLGDGERDVALKLWLWKITHTLHDYTPKVWTPWHDYNRVTFGTHSAEHPIRPDPVNPPNMQDEDQDSLRWTFSYGYALCSTLHGNIQPQIEAIGRAQGKQWRSRWVGLPGDTNHEIYFGGKWRMFDVNAGALLWSGNDAKTAELLPFAAAFGPQKGPNHADLLDYAPKFNGKYLPKLVWGKIDEDGRPEPYAWMRRTLGLPMYWDADEAGRRYSLFVLMYYPAYNACPIVYDLKTNETFTRWFDGDEARKELGLPRRIWWGANIEGGPGTQSHWGHYLRDLPQYCKDAPPLVFSEISQLDGTYAGRDSRASTHGNGLYEWQPDLGAGEWEEGAVAIDGPVLREKGTAGLTAAGRASVTFGFFSPYTIAAMPIDNTDPAKDGATGGAILQAPVEGEVPVEVSVNNGLSFRAVGVLKGDDARIDFTDAVKGRNQYLLRVSLDTGRNLKSLRLRTVVTTCRAIYPKLKSDRTAVTYAADGLNGFEASPDFASEDLARAPGSFVSQENLRWVGYQTENGTAWETDKDVAGCIYKVTAPQGKTLTSVSAAANLTWPAPTRKGSWGEIAVSASPKGPWTIVRKVDPREDDTIGKNDCPWYWVYGTADVAERNLRTAYVRVRFAGSGRACGITYLYLFGTYQAGNTSPLAITYLWKSGDEMRRHQEIVPAGKRQHTYTIETGKDVKNVKVVFGVGESK